MDIALNLRSRKAEESRHPLCVRNHTQR
jgi:hypothetical protein